VFLDRVVLKLRSYVPQWLIRRAIFNFFYVDYSFQLTMGMTSDLCIYAFIPATVSRTIPSAFGKVTASATVQQQYGDSPATPSHPAHPT
jgi:hypothetical protein